MNLYERVGGEPRNLHHASSRQLSSRNNTSAECLCHLRDEFAGTTLFSCLDRCTILHVEDEDGSACLFRAALDEAGIGVSVYRVSDGEQALAFLHQAGIYRSARRPEL